MFFVLRVPDGSEAAGYGIQAGDHILRQTNHAHVVYTRINPDYGAEGEGKLFRRDRRPAP